MALPRDRKAGSLGRILALLFALATAACDDFPRDPSHTYERVRGGTMTVGFVSNPPWVVDNGQEPTGIEADMARALARKLDARIVWVSAAEEDVFTALDLREIALVVGGLTRSSPWGTKVTFTRPYASSATVVAGPNAGLIEELHGLRVAVPRGSPAAAWVEDEDGIPVPQDQAGPDIELSARPAHALGPGEHVKFVLDTAQHVVAVPPGENRWLVEVDSFFNSRTVQVRQELETR